MQNKNLVVLLIEDSQPDALLLIESLRQVAELTFDIDHVENLAGAMQRIAKKSYDAVLLDLGLPDSSGLQTFETLRRQASDTPIIILSGTKDRQLLAKAMSQGADNYLIKESADGSRVAIAVLSAIRNHNLDEKQSRDGMSKAKAGTNTAAKKGATSQETVLVADSDPRIRELAGDFLKEANYSVTFAIDGYDALDQCRLTPPQWLLVDAMITKLDGIALIRLLRDDAATKKIKVGLFSLFPPSERVRNSGADAFVKKPLEKVRLLEAIAGALSNKGNFDDQ